MSDFDFSSADAWEQTTDVFLREGNYAGPICNADPTTRTSTNKPQLVLELQDDKTNGTIRDWLVITPKSIGKIAQLYDAAGVERPRADEVGSDGTLSHSAADRLVGKKVGFIVRDEPSLKDPAKIYGRVQGYVDRSRITSTGSGASSSSVSAGGRVADEDIPF